MRKNLLQNTPLGMLVGAIIALILACYIDSDVGEEEIRSALNLSRVPQLNPEDFADEIGLYARTFRRRFL